MKRLIREEWREFKGVTNCHIYFEEFEEDDKFSYKVRDYCHYTRDCIKDLPIEYAI